MSREDVMKINENGRKKMGRPIAGEPKDMRVSLRATKTTVEKFNKCSKVLGKSKTDLLEKMVNTLYQEIENK